MTGDPSMKRRMHTSRLGLWLAERAGRHPKSWLDRLALRMLERALGPVDPQNDFMHDELIESDRGYSARELEEYQRGGSSQ